MNTYSFRQTKLWGYILMAACTSSIILYYYAKSIPSVIPKDNLLKEICMCSGQILWQGIIMRLWVKGEITKYLSQMITISLLGSLALIPIIILNSRAEIGLEFKMTGFFLIVACMIIEHARRVKKIALPEYLTYTWILYRIFWIPLLLF
ncbi:hypothetical protein [Aquimarina pacifica]|uniref:hypothetical protein n=1 Tax=Aquimarina pacifica TaxID=1296415 RepID=UPI00046FF234|nr:hypothetical protein [Aquimarina pacifica]